MTESPTPAFFKIVDPIVNAISHCQRVRSLSDQTHGERIAFTQSISTNLPATMNATINIFTKRFSHPRAVSLAFALMGTLSTEVLAEISEEAYIKASNSIDRAQFGRSIAVSGDTMIVAAPFRADGGAVYVFAREGDAWVEEAVLVAPDGSSGGFGDSVDISQNCIVIGSSGGQGEAHFFAREDGTWRLQTSIKAAEFAPEDDGFGTVVAIDGGTAVIANVNRSLPRRYAAYVFERDGNHWMHQATLMSSSAEPVLFAGSVAISGDTIVVSEAVNEDRPDNAVHVFVRDETTWNLQALLRPPVSDGDFTFGGNAVAIFGETILVVGDHDDREVIGVGAGQIHVFERDEDAWTPRGTLRASNAEAEDALGVLDGTIAIDGDIVVAGAIGEDSRSTGINGPQDDNSSQDSGAAYAFIREGETWRQVAYLKASNTGAGDFFGFSVGVSGETVVIGAPLEASDAAGIHQADEAMEAQQNDGFQNSGAVYTYAIRLDDNDDDALRQWRLLHFGTAESEGLAADLADSDMDGLANLIEAATGSDPTLQSTYPVSVSLISEEHTFQFSQDASVSQAVLLQPEWSENLHGAWRRDGFVLSLEEGEGTIQKVTAILEIDVRRAFFRLSAERR